LYRLRLRLNLRCGAAGDLRNIARRLLQHRAGVERGDIRPCARETLLAALRRFPPEHVA
jgi:hypothetical protein